MWRCGHSLSGLPGCQRNPNSLCHSEDFSNKSLQGGQPGSIMREEKSMKFDWQNGEIIKGIRGRDRFPATWQMSLYMFCFIAWLVICWHSWVWSTSERVRKPKIKEDQEIDCESMMRLYCREVWSTVQTVRIQRSYIYCPKGIFRHNFLQVFFFPPIASLHLLSFHNPVSPLLSSPHFTFILLSFSCFAFHLSSFSFIPSALSPGPFIICPILLSCWTLSQCGLVAGEVLPLSKVLNPRAPDYVAVPSLYSFSHSYTHKKRNYTHNSQNSIMLNSAHRSTALT